MKIHITNLYNFNMGDPLVQLQHRYADSGRGLGFHEMGIFSYPVESDTPSELSKRLDGIIAALESEDVVIMQLPTRNGYQYERFLFDKIKAYWNTKVVLLFHDLQMFSQDDKDGYMDLCKRSECLILPSNRDFSRFENEGITQLLSCDDIEIADNVAGINESELLSSVDISVGYATLCREGFYIKKILFDAVEKTYLYQRKLMQDTFFMSADEIQIGFGLHDKTGNYSVWVGVAMQSIIEHTNSKVCFHILIDDTVSELNKNKLTQVAINGGQRICFHLLKREIFQDVYKQMEDYTIGAIFRVMLPEVLPDVSKIIYLDADILANRDISELWETDISDYCIAAVKDKFVVNGAVRPIVVKKGIVEAKNYFNSGVIFMNLNNIRKNGNMRDEVIEYLKNERGSSLPDQDALNVIYDKKTLYLDDSWNYFARPVQERGEKELKKCLYHYVGTRCMLYSMAAMERLYYETTSRTPWGIDKCREFLEKSFIRLNDRVEQLEKLMLQTSTHRKKYVFYGEENYAMRNVYDLVGVKEGDYRVLYNPIKEDNVILPCKEFRLLQEEKDEFIVFVLPEVDGDSGIGRLEQMGLVNGKDFFVIRRLLPVKYGGFL